MVIHIQRLFGILSNVRQNKTYYYGDFKQIIRFLGGFTSNIGKLRKVAIDYFKSEGIKCEVKDGELLFQFKDNVYTLQLCEGDDYAECGIVYECSADEYAALSTEDKTFIADKVNTDLYNHATVYAYNDSRLLEI